MENEIWAYDEPHYSGGNCHITMTKQEAIDWTRRVFASSKKYKDATDEQLFDEFVTVHCAYREDNGRQHNPRNE